MRPQFVSALSIIVCCVVVAGCAEQLGRLAQEAPKAAQVAPTPAQEVPTPAQEPPKVAPVASAVAQKFPRDDAPNDPRRMLIDDVNACVTREAQTKSLSRVDTETAAHAIIARCTGPLQEFKSYMAGHFPGNPPQFENWWRTEVADTLDLAKKAVALARAE